MLSASVRMASPLSRGLRQGIGNRPRLRLWGLAGNPVHTAVRHPAGRWSRGLPLRWQRPCYGEPVDGVQFSGKGVARVWDLATSKPLTEAVPDDRFVQLGALCPDGKVVVTGLYYDGQTRGAVRMWEAVTGKFLSPVLARRTTSARRRPSALDSQTLATSRASHGHIKFVEGTDGGTAEDLESGGSP